MDFVALRQLPIFVFLSIGAISVFSFGAVASWADARRREREAYYKKRNPEENCRDPGGTAALEFLREEEKNASHRSREGIKLGGLITAAVGIGIVVFLRAEERGEPAYLLGLVPLLAGIALLTYAYHLAPKDWAI